MSACEKCWKDAHRGPEFSVADEYDRLMRERALHPCTPEEQAGPDAGKCTVCGRMTMHQVTSEPMCGCQMDTEARIAQARREGVLIGVKAMLREVVETEARATAKYGGRNWRLYSLAWGNGVDDYRCTLEALDAQAIAERACKGGSGE